MILAVDSSVVVKTFVEEADSRLVDDILFPPTELHVPDLVFDEVANVFWRHWRTGQMSEVQVIEAMSDLQKLFSAVRLLRSPAAGASETSCSLEHPIYDCSYLALAERLAVPFLTADQWLRRKVEGSRWRNFVGTVPEIHALIAR